MCRYLLLLFIIAPSAWASNVTVANTGDSGSGSLRAALSIAGSGDTIVFDASLANQTITLASTLTITTNLTIDGAGSPGLVISGNNAVGVFTVYGADATFRHLTIANGNGIFSGTNGGGINSNNSAIVTVDSCTLRNNTAPSGGAILDDGVSMTVVNSTFSGNSASLSVGGAIDSTSNLTVENSSFVNNSAVAGGVIYCHNIGTAEVVADSLFAGNSNNGGTINGGVISDVGHILQGDHNLYWNNSASGGDCLNCASDTSPVTADPLLGSLANNGGPTQTYLPGAGSAAVAGLPAASFPPCLATDQRGHARGLGSYCEIGSVDSEEIFAYGFE